MTLPSPELSSNSILRLRAGLLVLVAFVMLCGFGGYFVATQFGLGLGWAILIAVIIWVGIGILLTRMAPKVYYGIALAITLLLAYLVYDFVTSALGWSSMVAAILAALATALLGYTFQDFLRLKKEIGRMIYRRKL